MSTFTRMLLTVAFVLMGAGVGRAADPRAEIDALLSRYQALGLFNGSVLVADRGQVVLEKGYGLANMEWNLPNAPDTKFRLGSLTKQFTATLVLQLVERGTLALDAPISRYLPDYPKPMADRVTLHHLLNHTSGIVGYTELPGFGETSRKPYTPAAFMQEQFATLDLLFEPGSKYSYSNSAYFVLGVILEAVTGQAYERLLQERIFTPVGMRDSGYDSTTPLLPKRAAGYDKRFDGSYVNTGYLDMSQPYSAGSLYSTVQDLYRWDQALGTETVLSAASKVRMFTPGLSDYGYGWTIRRRDGVTTIEHGGGINGFNTLLTRNPDAKRVIILLNNTGGAPLGRMAEGVRAILDGKPPTWPKRPGALPLFETYRTSGLDATLTRAAEMKKGSEFDAGFEELARLADQLLSIDKPADALRLAETLAADVPTSAPLQALLGRAHRANGHRIEALQAYSRAIAFSDTPRAFPQYTAAIKALSTLARENER